MQLGAQPSRLKAKPRVEQHCAEDRLDLLPERAPLRHRRRRVPKARSGPPLATAQHSIATERRAAAATTPGRSDYPGPQRLPRAAATTPGRSDYPGTQQLPRAAATTPGRSDYPGPQRPPWDAATTLGRTVSACDMATRAALQGRQGRNGPPPQSAARRALRCIAMLRVATCCTGCNVLQRGPVATCGAALQPVDGASWSVPVSGRTGRTGLCR